MPPKLPILSAKRVIQTLEQNGFELDHVSESHYIFYNLKTKRRVTVPYHTKDLPRGTMMSIIKQSGLDSRMFS